MKLTHNWAALALWLVAACSAPLDDMDVVAGCEPVECEAGSDPVPECTLDTCGTGANTCDQRVAICFEGCIVYQSCVEAGSGADAASAADADTDAAP